MLVGLGDVAVFVKNVRELFSLANAEVVVVVMLGAFAMGFGAHWLWTKLKRRRVRAPSQPCPLPHKSEEEGRLLNRIQLLLTALDSPEAELWQLGKGEVPHALFNRLHSSRTRVLTFANLKGGVGKTTLAANIAAYFAQSDEDGNRTKGYTVLLIDFDYQGNLSTTVLRAAGKQSEPYCEADRILGGTLSPADLTSGVRLLGPGVPNVTLVPATLELAKQENRLLLRHLLVPGEADPRFSLLKLLSDETVLSKFELVVIDTPPRLTLGTIASLCASTHVVIPTILDNGSVGNVRDLVVQLDRLFRKDLNPRIELAGIVGTMTARQSLDRTELASRLTVETAAQENWGERAGGIETIAVLEDWPDDAYVLRRNIPDTARFREDAGIRISVLAPGADHAATRAAIMELGRQIAKRIN